MSLKNYVIILLVAALAAATFRALFLYNPSEPPQQCQNTTGHHRISLDQRILERFKTGLNFKTISYSPHKYEAGEMIKIIDFIEKSYPTLHGSSFVRRELISNYTLMYTFEGSDKELRPYLLVSHLDVVPTVDESWSSDPFRPVVKEDKNLYARGTIDAKHLVFAILESLESLLKDGFKPSRGIYLVFGHDEESGGKEGAVTVAGILPERLKRNNWDKFEYILDEGTIISTSPIMGVNAPVALVGVAEKGMATFKVTTKGAVGHSSMAPPMTAITKLSKAIGKFHSHLLPSFFGQGPEREMIEAFAYKSQWPYKFVYANFWLFQPVFEYIFSQDPALNSLIRSSTAVTMISGGTKSNVLPDSASAYINHRIHPSQTVNEVLEFDKQIINDETIKVELVETHSDPSPVAPYGDDAPVYQLIKRSVQQIYPNAVVVPSVFLAASDSRHFVNLTDCIYKFSAIAITLEELTRFHGHDERISLDNYENLINFYHHLIMNSDHPNLGERKITRDEL